MFYPCFCSFTRGWIKPQNPSIHIKKTESACSSQYSDRTLIGFGPYITRGYQQSVGKIVKKRLLFVQWNNSQGLPGCPGAPGPGPAAVTLQLGFILRRPGLDGLEPPRGSRGSRRSRGCRGSGGGLGGKRPGDLGHGSSLVKSLLGKYNI